MSSYSVQFFKDHPFIGGGMAVLIIGGSLFMNHRQAEAAFNTAVTQCERGFKPQHIQARPKLTAKSRRTERRYVRRINGAIDKALATPACKGPRW